MAATETVAERPDYDPVALAESLASAADKSAKVLGDFIARQAAAGKSMVTDEFGLTQAFLELAAKMLSNPYRLAETQMNLWWEYSALWQSSMLKLMGQSTTPVVEPAKSDKRFRHEDWEEHFLFDYVKQSYLIAARWLHNTVANVEGLDEHTRRKVDFFTRQYIDALAPSNFALTNPEGVNIATTPGHVVFQNDLMQLIQYEPATAKVAKRPLLIMPPWINKYYILDLREKNSLIKWCVAQGLTVFVISWVNPDERHAAKDFVDYMLEGPLAALDAIEKATGEKDANVLGYCLGGTLLAAALGHLAAKKDKRIVSASFMTSLIDFTGAGELEVFIDEEQVSSLERKMSERGYLEGSHMANTFNMLRSNDLIWSFVINNYLMGRDPFPFDLLHWNQDSTRMPAKMHSFYLRNMYMRNKLREPGGISLAGTPIDVSKVAVPAYFVSAIEDHIAPWKTTYAGTQLLGGKSRFVLSGSGHIAGMINPPEANKYGYWTNEKLPATAEEWFKDTKQHPGSWWKDWIDWLQPYLGPQVAAREVGKAVGKTRARVIEAAPGSYARQRADVR